MPYAFKDVDEKCNFLCVCLKSAIENGGKVDQASVANTLNYPRKKVTTFLSLVKKTGDALFNREDIDEAGGKNEAGVSEEAEVPKKRKPDSTRGQEQLPEAKRIKVEEASKAT